MMIMRGTTALAAASVLFLAEPTTGEEEGRTAIGGGPLRRTAATVGINTSGDTDASQSNGLVTLPLLPHRAVLDRRRRERRLMGYDDADDDADAHYDEVHSDGYPRRRLTENASKPGGRTEIMSLYQGFGTHYVDLWVGTPPQRQTVIVDTGSGVTAFPCASCNNCGESYHTDGYFVEADSSTFQKLDCDSPCFRGRCSGSGSTQICRISMSYQVRDTVVYAILPSSVCYGRIHTAEFLITPIVFSSVFSHTSIYQCPWFDLTKGGKLLECLRGRGPGLRRWSAR